MVALIAIGATVALPRTGTPTQSAVPDRTIVMLERLMARVDALAVEVGRLQKPPSSIGPWLTTLHKPRSAPQRRVSTTPAGRRTNVPLK